MDPPYSTLLQTERLSLRLMDPNSDQDCLQIMKIYNDVAAGMGGYSRVGMNKIQDVRVKHTLMGPNPALCTKVTPSGLYHCIYLKSDSTQCLGFIGLSFRKEMPYPDLGYGLFRPYWGKWYAPEACREAMPWWREDIGVKELFITAFVENRKSEGVAERIGFVKKGSIEVCFGDRERGDVKVQQATAWVLPEMDWQELDPVTGDRRRTWPTFGTETEEQKTTEIKVG